MHIPASITPGSSMYWSKQSCLSSSAVLYGESTTTAPRTWNFAGAERGHFFMARGVRQCCSASGFLCAIAFDSIFRWFQRSPDDLEFLQPAQCAYADDLDVASFSFRELMTALAPAFREVDSIACLNLNYRKCCLAQYRT